MRFKGRGQGSGVSGQRKTKLVLAILFLASLSFLSIINYSYAELVGRVVAVVNREVILYSELESAVEKAKSAGQQKAESEVLEELIDRTLLLEQAMRFRVDIETYVLEDGAARKMIDDYINRRIKAFIHVPFEEIENYYLSHKDDFNGRGVYDVWDEIENRLRIDRLTVKLDEHISMLRKEAYIKIQLDNAD
jgi:hypothetical protein